MSERPQHSERQLSHRYSWIALALAIVAGAVDGIGYLLLAHVFTSHMSGNTVALTMYFGEGRWHDVWKHGEPILIFFAGIMTGLVLTDILVSLKLLRMFSVVAGTEVVLLLAFFALAHPARQWMVVFPAAAMGIQNAMLRRVGHHRVRTTFVTGMITNAAQGLVDAAHAVIAKDGDAREKIRDFLFYGGIWVLFAGGGICGALIELRYGAVALWLPLGGLVLLIGYDLVRPLTAEPTSEEQQGSAA